jgi:hypothetical protein
VRSLRIASDDEMGVKMKSLALVALAAGVLVGCGTETATRTVTVVAAEKSGVGPPRQLVEFGYIKSLTRSNNGYELRFDPAWFLMGETANVAAAEDGKVAPGEPVPNDNYRLDEGHRLLTYRVPADARVTVLKTSPKSTPITVSELARIVSGKSKRPLWEPIATGFWIRVDIDTVRSLDQQYLP